MFGFTSWLFGQFPLGRNLGLLWIQYHGFQGCCHHVDLVFGLDHVLGS